MRYINVKYRYCKYVSGYSILLDDILLSIYEIRPVGKNKINPHIDNDDYNEIVDKSHRRITYFTKDFYREIN